MATFSFTFYPKSLGRKKNFELVIPSLNLHISEGLSLILVIEHDDRDTMIFINHLEHQTQIRIFISLIERAHSFCPHLHPIPFLHSQIPHQEMRHEQRGDSNQNRCYHPVNLHLSYPIRPIHAAKIQKICEYL